MTRDQNGTWEMESNDNFEGYMKALGVGMQQVGERGGEKGREWQLVRTALASDSAAVEFPRLCLAPSSDQLCSMRQAILIC